MSERLSSVEIEDVLSSIRRLVSEDLRPGAKPAEAAAPAPAAPPVAEVGKLVLTPAHRIPSEPEQATGTFSSVRGRSAAPAYEEDAEVPGPETARGHDWFEFAGAGDSAEKGGALAEHPVEVEGPVSAAEDWSVPPEPGSEREPEQAQQPGGENLPEPEDVLSGFDARDEGADWLPEDEPVTPSAAEMAEEAAMPDVLEPEEAVRSRGAVQTDEDWADAAEAEIRRELEAEAEASVFTRFDAAEEVDAGEPVFDEEMLRDLVRDIIREELQGALGERITRNVRKLVRAEIARALAVRDFE